jgi:ferric-dicitrate binding protein FerR (iron transport regulator)
MPDLPEESPPTHPFAAQEQAGVWLARMESDDFDRQKFLRWLKASPRHVHDILEIVVWHQLIEMTLVPAASRNQNGTTEQAQGGDIYRRVLQKLNG